MFIRLFIQLLPILVITKLYAFETDSSLIYYNLGLKNASETKFERSEFYFRKAIDWSRNVATKANLYTSLGIVLKNQGKYKSAFESYKKAETYTNDNELLSKIYINQGIIKRIGGDYQKALLLYENALEFTSDKEQKAFVYNNIANIYYGQHIFRDALRYYKQSLEIKEKTDITKALSTYLNIALCYQQLRMADSAELFFTKTIRERIKLLGKQHYRLIIAYTNYGNFLMDIDPEKSFELLEKANALALLHYGDKHPETARTFTCLGNFFAEKRQYKKALEFYQKALIANNKMFGDMDTYRNSVPGEAISEMEQLDILHHKAIAFNKYANTLQNGDKELKMSLATYELAIETLFKLQHSFMDESKRTLIANKKDMFAEAAYTAIQLNDYPKAFRLIERGKAFTLLAAVNNNEAIRFGDIPDSLVALENEYKRLLFVYSANENTDSLLFYQAKYDSLIAYFETHYPKYYSLKYSLVFVDPCRHLNSNHVLLEYALTDTLCITLVVTKEGYRHYVFRTDSIFYKNIETFVYSLKNYNLDEEYREQYRKVTGTGYYLWKKLLEPLHIPEGKSLIVVPDGILSYVNFEALLYELQEDADMNYYLLKYLVYRHPVSYSYSTLWLFEPFTKSAKKNIGAFAVDYRGRKDVMLLMNSVPEAEQIARSYKGTAYINEDCTREAFLNNADAYKILHLSLHGDIDLEDTDASKLAFYNTDVYAWEVYGMHMNVRMVYLSACSTGSGKLDKGEGIFSMGRAFAYAGCPTIIMSLWTEKDNMSHITMDFYKYLDKGYALDKAMQRAKINHLKQKFNAHPHYWANKIIMGKTGPLRRNAIVYLVFGILIVVVVFIVVLIRGKG